MTRSLLLTCNSRSATIAIHDSDAKTRKVGHLRDVALPVPVGEAKASPMALSADGALVHVAWRGAENRLLTFALDRATADLSLVQNRVIGDDICFLHATADGRRLLGAGGNSVVGFVLNRQGLPAEAIPPLQIGPMAHCVMTDRNGRMFATACRGDLLASVDDSGVVVHLRQPEGCGPRHFCLSPDGQHLYLVTQESGELVSISTDGGLHECQRLKMVDDSNAPMGGDIGITPDGRFIYATERSANRVVGFAVETNGTLRRIGGADVPDYPRAICIGGGGKFLAVLGFRGHRAATFDIADDGALMPAAEFATGERPSWILSVEAA